MSQDFGKPATYYSLGKRSPLTILFSFLLHSLPMLPPLWESQGRLFILKLTGESFSFQIFLKFSGLQFCYSVFKWQIFSTEIYLSLLLQDFPNSAKGWEEAGGLGGRRIGNFSEGERFFYRVKGTWGGVISTN